ncbi:endolytic transglycosylase MltG [Oscillospiraceae bacterium PP1C4]
MSDKNEFDGLIKNFKLDDIKQAQTPAMSGARRSAFNYDEDNERHLQVQKNANGQQTVRQLEHRADQGGYSKVRAAKEQGKKRSFHVNIDDNQFYEASAGSDSSPHLSAGGGGNDDYDNGGNGDGPDDGGGSVNRWVKALVVLVVVLGVSVFLAFFALESASDLFGLNKQDNQIEIKLPENLSMSEIASLLKDDGIIRQPLTFQLYAGLKNKAENFIPGTYLLNSNMSYDEIMVMFKTGNTKKVEVMLLFYEGMTLNDMADKLEENKVCSKKELFDYLDAGKFPWEYKFLESVPEDANRFRRYEGYFFPDTYEFYEDMSPTDVTRKFFSNFNNKIDDELYAKMEKMGMTLDQTITLASIIQREVGNVKDMGYVSSVFHNRLNDPQTFPNLQSDTTREYVESDIKPYVNVTNQAMYDAYNSDAGKRVGLPVGPICNPGLDAIEAALKPTDSNYYFFVCDVDGLCYYATTDAEHEQNKAIAKAKGKTHGIDTENASSK